MHYEILKFLHLLVAVAWIGSPATGRHVENLSDSK